MHADERHGPFFDSLSLGDTFDQAPSVTLTDGLAAAHQAIVGGRQRLALDRGLAMKVAGAPLAAAPLVWDVSIGQSTLVTQRAIANLFYRGLRFLRFPAIGDTLTTRTEIVGLRPAEPKPGRPPRGLVVMHIRTSDQEQRPVLDYYRCALLPARIAVDGPAFGDMAPGGDPVSVADFATAAGGWDLARYRAIVPGPHFAGLREGDQQTMPGDLVSSAPEMARLTLNLAAVHHDAAASADGRRLVYGGHTVGLAASQASRAFPAIVAILGWHSCDHLGPVREGDTLRTTLQIERLEPLSEGGVAHIAATVTADRPEKPAKVLDWRFVALFA
jgi:acyl dehydratase